MHFFRMLDVGGVNEHVLHQSFKNRSKVDKGNLLKQLANGLVMPHLGRRATNFQLNCELPRTIFTKCLDPGIFNAPPIFYLCEFFC